MPSDGLLSAVSSLKYFGKRCWCSGQALRRSNNVKTPLLPVLLRLALQNAVFPGIDGVRHHRCREQGPFARPHAKLLKLPNTMSQSEAKQRQSAGPDGSPCKVSFWHHPPHQTGTDRGTAKPRTWDFTRRSSVLKGLKVRLQSSAEAARYNCFDCFAFGQTRHEKRCPEVVLLQVQSLHIRPDGGRKRN